MKAVTRAYRRDPLVRLVEPLAAGSSPTADLYLRWSCADLIESGRLEQVAATVFRTGDTAIVIRHDAGARLQGIRRHIYVVDDDLRAGIRGPGIPLGLRAKNALLDLRAEARLAPTAAAIVVSSDRLKHLYALRLPDTPVHLTDPAWPQPPEPEIRAADMPLRIACLLARSHATDFGIVRTAIERALSEIRTVEITVSANLPVPDAWYSDTRVTVLPAMGWRDYSEWMRGQRFDIGLYPLAPGAFNAARSSNKLGEYAQFGAAVLTSLDWDIGRAAAAEGRCVALGEEATTWFNAISALAEAPRDVQKIACTNRAALIEAGTAKRQRALWCALLGFEPA